MVKINVTKDTSERGSLILVSPNHPFIHTPSGKDMVPAFKEEPSAVLDVWAAAALQSLIKCVHAEELIVPVSGFRTKEEQEHIWEDSVRENGLEFTKKYVAVPGHSEHQTGFAIDLAEKKEEIDFICPRFPYTGKFLEFRKRAPEYGFVERYIRGKEDITGIGAEPWHFRYVGYPHSVIMTENGMVLEEYIDFLKCHTDYEHPYVYRNAGGDIRISYLPVNSGDTAQAMVGRKESFVVSGTNEGGAVLLRWRGPDR